VGDFHLLFFASFLAHSGAGQFLPPSFVAAMEELASTPDAEAHNPMHPAPSKGTRNWCNFQIESGQRDLPKSHQVAASVPTAGLASFGQIIVFLVR
jgi:hypothetical protein